MLDEKFIKRMETLLGREGLELYLSELEKPSPRALRVNALKGDENALDIDITPVPYSKNCYYFDHDKIGNHPMHHAGLIYIQEPGAMVPVASVDIESDWKVFDTCSAPGGKSLQAAAFLGDDGFILSNEINTPRARIMSGNFERMGVRNYVITSAPVDKVSEKFKSFFDLVIVDAPCSGEGMFRKEEDAVKDWSEENVRMCAERQKGILQAAAHSVKGGGYLLYSTCTFSTEENEDTVNAFLAENGDFELVSPNERVVPYTVSGVGDEKFRRFYPHIAPGEGQFCALMKRKGDEEGDVDVTSALSQPTKDEMVSAEDFLKDTLISFDRNYIKKFKDFLVYINPEIPVPEKVTYSCGVTLGEAKKGYFMPHHHLFSAMGKEFKRKIDLPLDDARICAYLRGESFSYDIENGWCAVLIDGIPLGGGKAVNGQIKNHYPKGLRIQH
ncbi:MAG: hypothetical protein E7613_07055 [Ruminococcaceae bacterium]|nr:hypothetical protein [Oscillospiraceae bacterium]